MISTAAFAVSVLTAGNLFSLFRALSIVVYIQLANYIMVPLIVFTAFLVRDKPAPQQDKPQ
jgi:hypothetical protein